MAFIGAGAVTHKMTGTDYAMWTAGIAFVLYLGLMFIVKNINQQKNKHSMHNERRG
jgi:arginine exporter protein ArgO